MRLEEIFERETRGLIYTVRFGEDLADFLWGFQYTRPVQSQNRDGMVEKREVEVAYQSRHGNLLYVVRADSLNQIRRVSSYPPVRDLRFALFTQQMSRRGLAEGIKLYKAFFRGLIKRRREGLITDDEFMKAFFTVNRLYNQMHAEMGNVQGQKEKTTIMRGYQELMRLDPDVQSHFAEAKAYIAKR